MVNWGLEAFIVTDGLQRVLFYTKMLVSCILDFFCMISHKVTRTMADSGQTFPISKSIFNKQSG